MKLETAANLGISERLEGAIIELLALQEVLSSDEIDGRVLNDFRDALNRVRNTAWATQKFIVARLSEGGPASLISFPAAERVRAAFQMCRAVQEDLKRQDIDFQKGQLCELDGMVRSLSERLKARL